MIKIGLTGGIGSGKSVVAKIFETLGIPVYNADTRAKYLIAHHPDIQANIKRYFGDEAYTDGRYNTAFISNLVFNDPIKLEKLNSIIHPVVIKDANDWFAQQQSHYALKEAALIFESNAQKELDYVIGVNAPEALRIKWIGERDRLTEQEIKARIDKQMDQTQKMKLCQFVITNNEEDSLLAQVISLHQTLLALSK
jgi:dephospho-CoA kinase